MEHTNCPVCGDDHPDHRFDKKGPHEEFFTLVRCRTCGLEYLNPRPLPEEMGRYYGEEYFTTRTERGYDNYFSETTKKEVQRVLALNLADLGFFHFEENLPHTRRNSLDIGCASGYCVDYLAARGWDAAGIEISEPCVSVAQQRGLNVTKGDYLSMSYPGGFSLITMWASIEHMHRPDLFIQKISGDLAPGGMVLFSTCRADRIGFRSLYGKDWRYYNFPEHLCFFSSGNLKKLLERNGLEVTACRTYGSGVGSGGTLKRRLADRAAKKFYLGDMMIIAARKSAAR